MSFEDKTDEQMLELYRKSASEMSYFNAAENEAWYKERFMREHCRLMLAEIKAELQVRNLETPIGNYLI